MTKFLVAARVDRGSVSVGAERVTALMKEYGFARYFATSAKEGWQVDELREAIQSAVSWSELPEVTSSQLFSDIKRFLLDLKQTGRILSQTASLYDEFTTKHPGLTASDLDAQFETCVGRLENRDLIRRLSFGGYVLLQSELLDAYASAMVNAAKLEPDGLGSLSEEIALAGKFFVPGENKVPDSNQEELLLYATVEELVRHDLALRESAEDGRYLVFPSQINRDYEDAPDPKGKAIAITFEGPVQSVYATLVVRLGHSGLFATGRAEMWRNASVYSARSGGKCGLYLHEFSEGRGRLVLFYDDQVSKQTRFHFEEFVLAHARKKALEGSVEILRYLVCNGCGEPVPDTYVKRLRERGADTFLCPCGSAVPLVGDGLESFESAVVTMDRAADSQRELDAFVVSASGETRTASFRDWAGDDRVTLAIVFTDVVGSTALGEELRDETMSELRRSHFKRAREVIKQFRGREIKTIGDSVMVAFRAVDSALDFCMEIMRDTGNQKIRIRAGVHIGVMEVEENDVFGGTVNFAARVVGAIAGNELWLSDAAKSDVDRLGSARHSNLMWRSHENVEMKGFSGRFRLWSLQSRKSAR
jgi:class 3 adenylate cyclase